MLWFSGIFYLGFVVSFSGVLGGFGGFLVVFLFCFFLGFCFVLFSFFVVELAFLTVSAMELYFGCVLNTVLIIQIYFCYC